jgi:hypothetical protein
VEKGSFFALYKGSRGKHFFFLSCGSLVNLCNEAKCEIPGLCRAVGEVFVFWMFTQCIIVARGGAVG